MPGHPWTIAIAVCLQVAASPAQVSTSFTGIGPSVTGFPITQNANFTTPAGCNDILVYPYPQNDLFIDQNVGDT